MTTMKTRLRERLDPYLLPEVRDQVITDILEELEEPTPFMLERGADRMVGSVGQPMQDVVREIWEIMIDAAGGEPYEE